MGLLCSLGVFTACSDDRDDNPTLQVPTQFVLNAPNWAGSSYDLAQSPTVALTCEQPNYGADITTRYTVEVATKADMSNATAISTVFHTTKLDIDAAEMASALTTQAVESGKAESDFPLDLPVYVRVKAKPVTAMGSEIDSLNHAYAITSNVVKLSRVHLKFSLPPVAMPEHLYITGNFNGWNWDRAVEMVPVNGTDNLFWHMVYIDASGIKFNTARAWNGSEQGFGDITLDAAGELAGTIVNAGGNIASSAPGWYLRPRLSVANSTTPSPSTAPTCGSWASPQLPVIGASKRLPHDSAYPPQLPASLSRQPLLATPQPMTICASTSRFREWTGGGQNSWSSAARLNTVARAATKNM